MIIPVKITVCLHALLFVLWAMAAEMRAAPKLTPTTAARLVAIRTGVGHSLESTIKRLRDKWNALPRQDRFGVQATWWADKIRAGGYSERADQLLNETEKTTGT